MKKHFVTFYSPGTFFAEESTRAVDSWDVEVAREMAGTITERHGAKPYGFQFSTRERGEDDLDSHVSQRSWMYFLGGQVLDIAGVEALNAEGEYDILLSNMKGNGWERVVINDNSWRSIQPLQEGDMVI